MSADQDREKQLARLDAKLKPESIRATLAFAGLYQMTHEMIKKAVVDKVREFYCRGFGETGMIYDEDAYRGQVRSRHKQVFRASLLWLVDAGAITLAQADRLDEIHAHRHDLTHEIAKYIVDPNFEPKLDLFSAAIEILRDINRFWLQVKIDKDELRQALMKEFNLSIENVTTGALMILEKCICAYRDGLPSDEERAAAATIPALDHRRGRRRQRVP